MRHFANIEDYLVRARRESARPYRVRAFIRTCHNFHKDRSPWQTRFNFFPIVQKDDELTAMHPSEATTLVQKIARLLKDKLELYQGIDLTHNNLLINIINDVVAGRFSTMEPKHDLHVQELSS